jgi:hypothetical protein
MIWFPIPNMTPNHRTPGNRILHHHVMKQHHSLTQTAKLRIHLQKSIASEQAAVESRLNHNGMYHAMALPRTEIRITRNQAQQCRLCRLSSIHRPHLTKQSHSLTQEPNADISTDYHVPCHRVPPRHSVKQPACSADVTGLSMHPDQGRTDQEVRCQPSGRSICLDTPAELDLLRRGAAHTRCDGQVVRVAVGHATRRHVAEQRGGLALEAQGEVPSEHGVVEKRLGRSRGRRGGERGRRDGGVEHPARGIGVAEAGVAGDEEGREVAVPREAGDDGERVRATRVAAGVGGGDGGGEGFLEDLVPVGHGGHLVSDIFLRQNVHLHLNLSAHTWVAEELDLSAATGPCSRPSRGSLFLLRMSLLPVATLLFSGVVHLLAMPAACP